MRYPPKLRSRHCHRQATVSMFTSSDRRGLRHDGLVAPRTASTVSPNATTSACQLLEQLLRADLLTVAQREPASADAVKHPDTGDDDNDPSEGNSDDRNEENHG